MKVLVTGGRYYDDPQVPGAWAYVRTVLDQIHAGTPITLIITGACPYGGADELAERWAKLREIDYRGFPAKFKTGPDGGGEGPKRNRRMAETERPDLVVAFPGDRGTRSMVEIALSLGIPVQDRRGAS